MATQGIDIEVMSLTIPDSEGSVVEAIGRTLRDGMVAQFGRKQAISHVMFMIQAKGGRDVDLIQVPQALPLEHRLYATWLKQCVKSFAPFMVVQMSEVWMLRSDTPEEREEFERWRGGVRRDFSEHPDRIEKVWLSMEHRAGVECWTAGIERPEGNPATLGAWGQTPTEATVSGRLLGLMDLPH